MRRPFSQATQQALGSVLALVLLLTTVPLTSGVAVFSGPAQPEFTINICQPIQTFEGVSNSLLARPAMVAQEFVLFCWGLVKIEPTARIVECRAAPQTPPPKRFA